MGGELSDGIHKFGISEHRLMQISIEGRVLGHKSKNGQRKLRVSSESRVNSPEDSDISRLVWRNK